MNEEIRFLYSINPKKLIRFLNGNPIIPPIRTSKTLSLTKEEVRECLKYGSLYRRFANEGVNVRVTLNNIDRLHNAKLMTEEEYENNLREEVYKTILSIDEMQDAEVPTQIKSEDRNPEESIEFIELKHEIMESMKKLSERERELIECKFFQEKKLREISEEFNISQSRISRIIQAGLDKIKKDLARQGII